MKNGLGFPSFPFLPFLPFHSFSDAQQIDNTHKGGSGSVAVGLSLLPCTSNTFRSYLEPRPNRERGCQLPNANCQSADLSD